MRAAVMTGFRDPLEVQELPDPTPGPNDAVVRVEGCGICRSDWHLWQGDWAWIGIELDLPLVMGHEFGGVVEAIGSNVHHVKPGDRVTVPFHMGCGGCEYCYSHRSNLCRAHGVVGVHFSGGYGRYALIPDANVNLVHLPEEVDFISAATLGCRYMTSYHGVVDQAKIQPGEWLAVFGVGAIGLSAVQIASELGAQVIAIDLNQEKLNLAKAEGAIAIVNASEHDPVEAVKEISKGGVNVSLDAIASVPTTLSAINCLQKGGRHLQLGLTGQSEQGMVSIPADAMVFNEIRFIGSVGCPVTSYPGLLTLVANGKLAPKRLVTKTVSVEQASDVLSSMTQFSTVGFNVINTW